MKARIKATDRIIEVMCVMNIEGKAVWEDISGISTTPIQYTSDELEFLDFPEMPIVTYTPDYWTRLEHTYVGMFMKSFLVNFDGTVTMEQLSDDAIVLAHALVEKMKEERK